MGSQLRSGPVGGGAFYPPQPLADGRPYFIASLFPLTAGLVGSAPPLTALLVGAAIAGLGALRSLAAIRESSALRRLADELLISGASPTSSPLLGWRASELVSRSNRRVLARSLRAIPAESEALLLASPLNRRGVRPHLDLVRALAERVGTIEEPVAPRGMALVEQLLCDGFGPLYSHAKVNELPGALERCLTALGPVADSSPPCATPPAKDGRRSSRRPRRSCRRPKGVRL